MYLEKELNITRYEREKLSKALEDMRKQIEEKVPAIAEVEERRLQLENEAQDRGIEIRNL